MNELPDGSLLYLDGSRGIYIPQNFAEETKKECVSGITDEDWEILLKGPEEEWYWEAWDMALNNAEITEPETGKKYILWQDGDLWIVPADATWPEEEKQHDHCY